MDRILKIFLAVMLLCSSFSTSQAADFLDKKIDCDTHLNNITVDEFFQLVGKKSGVEFFPEEDIKGELLDITMSKGKSYETLLDAVSQIYHLQIDKVRDIYIVKKENVGEKYCIYGQINSKEYGTALEGVKISIGNRIISPTYSGIGGKYIIPNIDPGVFILKFEKDGYVEKHELINLKEKITELDVALERDNSIKKEIECKEEKKHQQQVRISAQILDITNNLFESLGFDWVYSNSSGASGGNGVNVGVLSGGSILGIGQVYNSSIGVARQFNSGHDILNLGINLLEATQDLIVSARPSILVVDGEKGSFKVTEEVIVGNKKKETGKKNRIVYDPIFKEAGIILEVVPVIEDGGEILLNLLIEVSNFKLKKQEGSIEDTGTFNAEGGSKVGRSVATTIRVKDGETIFIGGLKRAIVHNLDSKIPYVGNIPFVRNLFSNRQISHESSDVYIKLKVDII